MNPIPTIKDQVDIVDLIGRTFEITGRGRRLSTKEHDSLAIWPDTNSWYWFSRGVGGDVLDWYQHIENVDFRTALEDLARIAGVELVPPTPEQQAAHDAQRQARRILILAAEHYQALLWSSAGERARDWCHNRAWTDETIRREGIGWSGDNNTLSADDQPLSAKLRAENFLDHPMARAVLSIPRDHIIYVHRGRDRLPCYLSARSVEGRRHYALPASVDIDGVAHHVADKQPYRNAPATGRSASVGAPVHILVEGPADAVALSQIGLRADALCGTAPATMPERERITHLGLDGDSPGVEATLKLVAPRGDLPPITGVIRWPGEGDAADALASGLTDEIRERIENASPAILLAAFYLRTLNGDVRRQQLDNFFAAYQQLDPLDAADLRPRLADHVAGGSIAQFNRLVKAFESSQEKNGDKPSPDRYEYSAGGDRGGLLWEQCLTHAEDGTPVVQFAVRDADGKIDTRALIDVAGTSYIPFPANMDLLDKNVVLFPSQPEEYDTESELLVAIKAFIHTYLDVDEFYEEMASYYVLFSWLYDLFETLPYLRALGDYGTGKTRFLQTIGALCYRPIFTSGASTVSPIFRIIDLFGGTLIVDEADLTSSDAENELIKIFNVGYYRGGSVLRSEKDPNSKYDEYWPSAKIVYGPKLLATRKQFTDRATESRCLTKKMTTARPRADIPYILGAEFWNRALHLRNQLLMYRLRNHRPITVDPALADSSVEPRLNQVTMALKSIIANPDMRARIDRFIRAYNEEMISERKMSVEAMVLQAIVDIHHGDADLYGERDYTLGNIAKVAGEYALEFDPDMRISARKVGGIVRALAFRTSTVRGGAKRNRNRADFTDAELTAAMNRYGIDKPEEAS